MYSQDTIYMNLHLHACIHTVQPAILTPTRSPTSGSNTILGHPFSTSGVAGRNNSGTGTGSSNFRWRHRSSSSTTSSTSSMSPSTSGKSSPTISLPFANTRLAVRTFFARRMSRTKTNTTSNGNGNGKPSEARKRRASCGHSFSEIRVTEGEEGSDVRVGGVEDHRVQSRGSQENRTRMEEGKTTPPRGGASAESEVSWTQTHWHHLVDPVAWGYFVAI